MSKGTQNASQVLCLTFTFLLLVSFDISSYFMSKCISDSSFWMLCRGLASILHCDEFRDLFPETTKVKCLSDAGVFLDA
jgi:hypothetical protein